MKLGAIDVGSNAIRVVIGEVSRPLGSWNYSKLAYLRLPVRLGEDVFDKGKISDSKVDQFVEGMKIFSSYLDFYGVTDFRAVATSAMRDSSNAKRIIEKIKNREFDLIIYGKVGPDELHEGSHPNMPLWEHVFEQYSRDEIVYLYGGDETIDMRTDNKYSRHILYHSRFAKCFVRELIF